MSGKSINFEDKKIKKSDFHKKKKLNKIEGIDINKILFSKKESCGTKNPFNFFIGYNDNDVIRSLCLRLPKMSGYARKVNENATMSSGVNDKQLLTNYYKI